MEIKSATRESVAVFELSGALDVWGLLEIGPALRQIGQESSGVSVLDLASVTEISSTAINVLLELDQAVTDRGARLLLAAPTEAVEKSLQLRRVHTAMQVVASVELAVTMGAPTIEMPSERLSDSGD